MSPRTPDALCNVSGFNQKPTENAAEFPSIRILLAALILCLVASGKAATGSDDLANVERIEVLKGPVYCNAI